LKLLFDANLSPRLVNRLAELFPGSAHVFETGLARQTKDETIWKYARENRLTIVPADSDFVDLARSLGAQPRVVRLEIFRIKAMRHT
jgi:predicted nuclease of predicted toxin-antitoxin system